MLAVSALFDRYVVLFFMFAAESRLAAFRWVAEGRCGVALVKFAALCGEVYVDAFDSVRYAEERYA